jgi:hypothetical protein
MLIFFNCLPSNPCRAAKYNATATINAWRANEIIRFTFDELRFFRGWLCGSIFIKAEG